MSILKEVRIGKMFDSSFSIYLDATAPLVQGKLKGLENLKDVVCRLAPKVDGILLNFGQLGHNAKFLGFKNEASCGTPVDWSNYKRKEYTITPRMDLYHDLIFNPESIEAQGADFCSINFLLGLSDSQELQEIEQIANIVQKANRIALPVLVNLLPVGEKINEENLEGSIELALSICYEMGADCFSIPLIKPQTIEGIKDYIHKPIFLRLNESNFDHLQNLIMQYSDSIDGIILAEKIFSIDGLDEWIDSLKDVLNL